MKIICRETRLWDEAETAGYTIDGVYNAVEAGVSDVRNAAELPAQFDIDLYPLPEEDLTPWAGTGGWAATSDVMKVCFDTRAQRYSVGEMYERIRSTASHEATHIASIHNAAPYDESLITALIYEGIATSFQQNPQHTAGVQMPFGRYYDMTDGTLRGALEEILALPPGIDQGEYLYKHPDGRKWIVYKTGTWVVDRLVRCGWTYEELIATKPERVLEAFRSLPR
jgi:hypothetical protein